jgi:uncharacterized membrane protein
MWVEDSGEAVRSRPVRRHLRPHSMLALVPVGCWLVGLAVDLAARRATDPRFLVEVSALLAELGLFGGAVACLAGFVDLRSVPLGTQTFRLAMWHLGAMLTVMVLYLASFVFRLATPEGQPVGALVVLLSTIAVAVIATGGAVGAFLAHRRI